MNYKTFTVVVNGGNIETLPGIMVTYLSTANGGIIPGITLGAKKAKSCKSFRRVFLDNQSYEQWTKNGYEINISVARIKDPLTKELKADSASLANRDYAFVLFKGVPSSLGTNRNIIAWAKTGESHEVILLVKKDDALKVGNYFVVFNGKNLKILIEA